MKVTDQMIKQACDAYDLHNEEGKRSDWFGMEAALIAALETTADNQPSIDRVAAQGGDELVEQGAIALWHRFGETNVEEWEDEVHQDEYRLAAEAVLALRATPADGGKLAKAIGDGV